MPNGANNPQCDNCDFFLTEKTSDLENDHARKWCQKHDFVFPDTGDEMICCNWRHNGRQDIRFSTLEEGSLYYYSYALPHAPQRLRPFVSLQNLIFSGSIQQDYELGWVILVSETLHEAPSGFIAGDILRVRLDDTETTFTITEIQRRRIARTERNSTGTWETTYKDSVLQVAYFPDNTQMLHTWLDRFVDVDRYLDSIRRDQFAEMLPESRFWIFVEEIEKKQLWSLFPNLLLYKDYRRD